ncbi:GNAT family N-acetyltransferase [Pedobacter petrophilus]|uniref:GNAT family N-acetyltransferase n=1 Tax=Pedobacter petrophilus TaxID=1908241 RepID=A0A7K0G4T6_9SPHI|nr:GNAT family N-acetyltransferase [Pedobacter petrophilus]MRX78662.1 GNAT family N-acetyltransferase [Pedobacter petrophilus]
MSVIYQSNRMVIREFLPSEKSLFCSFFEDEEVTQYLPRLQANEYEELFDIAITDYLNGPFGRWGIFEAENNNFIGNCLLRPFVEISGQMEIGYSLNKSYWGRGIGTEVAKALIAYGFVKTKTNEIVALTDLRNLGSQEVLKKSGFKQLGNISRKGVELNYFLIERT